MDWKMMRRKHGRLAGLVAVAMTVQLLSGGMVAAYGREGNSSGEAAVMSGQPVGAGLSGRLAGRRATGGNAWDGESVFVPAATGGNAALEIGVATPANLLKKRGILGDLWEDWGGNTDFPGDGTEEKPFQITGLAHLMGLSQAVAEGNDFAGTYFELTTDIDLGGIQINYGNWNPIGWYADTAEMDGGMPGGFSGVFDGGGNTIRGMQILQRQDPWRELGLFGVIDGGTVKHLTVKADTVCGESHVGILAGTICGDSVIYDVTVSGYAYGEADGKADSWTGHVGGIAGRALGGEGSSPGRVILENCTADGVILRSQDPDGFVGGIVGEARDADLADNTVYTQDGASDRIQGKGYIGGIAGVMEEANLYNSYVDGTIGGNGSRAVGGIVGKYESGDLILARFAGDISRTNNGTASREGTFVGTRDGRDTFTYGTERSNNLSYLFSNTTAKARRVFGSQIDGDNTFSENAHIGYWTDRETRYVILDGTVEQSGKDRYFYEELEDGVRFIITQKLDREFTAEGLAEEMAFRPDHFAPGFQGEPVLGYLLSVPRIDTKNANGTYDTDVALFTALPTGSNTYYRTIDKNHSAAVAPGVAVTVVTAPKNTEKNRYQMKTDPSEAGGVKPPTYINNRGKQAPMSYVAGGTYTFVMPGRDTQINVEYIKVTTALTMWPEEMKLAVTQTRSGDRKHPEILTEVRNEQGVLIARYIDGKAETEPQPVRIHGEHNQTGDAADRTMRWSVDDTDLLQLTCAEGYTTEDARIMPNLSGSFIQDILRREEKRQADSGYQEAIKPTVYEKKAVVTAVTNPESSADHQPVYGNCKVTVTFQIVDQTTRRVEGLNLNYGTLLYTVTRRLTGDRLHPTETLVCTEPSILSASLYPQQPFEKNVTWKDEKGGQMILLTPEGDNGQDCRVQVRFDPAGQANPAWIQNVLQRDNEKRKENPYGKLDGSASYRETVTATSEDQTHGVVSASCDVEIRFVTEDRTEVLPEQVVLNYPEITYQLSVEKAGKSYAPVVTYGGFEAVDLDATVYPDLAEEENYMPYDRQITWGVSDWDVATIDAEGKLEPKKDAVWIQEALKRYPYEAEKVIEAWGETKNGVRGTIPVRLTLKGSVRTTSSSGGSGSGGSGSGGSGQGASSGVTPFGSKVQTGVPAGSVTGTWVQTADGRWSFTSGERTYSQEWAYIHNPYADIKAGQSSADWFRFDATGHMVTGWFRDEDGNLYYLNPASDNTQGRMVTGWNWILGEDGLWRCYYFNEVSNGTRGALLRSAVTPDGYQVNEAGQWIVDGKVQTRS